MNFFPGIPMIPNMIMPNNINDDYLNNLFNKYNELEEKIKKLEERINKLEHMNNQTPDNSMYML